MDAKKAEEKEFHTLSDKELKELELAEAKLDLEVEKEWKEAIERRSEGTIQISSNPHYKSVCEGFSM